MVNGGVLLVTVVVDVVPRTAGMMLLMNRSISSSCGTNF